MVLRNSAESHKVTRASLGVSTHSGDQTLPTTVQYAVLSLIVIYATWKVFGLNTTTTTPFLFFFFMREKTELQRSETELFRCTKEHFLKLIQPELFFPKYCKALSRLCPLPGHPKGLGEAQAVGYYGNKRSFNQHCCPSPPDSLIPFICSLQTTHNVQAYCITKYIYYNYTSDSIWANEGEKKRKLDLFRFLNLDSGVKQFHS